eukprot:scaffold70631_cov55-Phaeocystis_antarctica.AAC.1
MCRRARPPPPLSPSALAAAANARTPLLRRCRPPAADKRVAQLRLDVDGLAIRTIPAERSRKHAALAPRQRLFLAFLRALLEFGRGGADHQGGAGRLRCARPGASRCPRLPAQQLLELLQLDSA